MSRVCPITGKGPVSGNNRSHSVLATRRVWNVNLQKYKIEINGKMVEVRMSARAYRFYILKPGDDPSALSLE
jgi:large subunit ribosomal protein L28